MSKGKKSNPNAELEGLPQELKQVDTSLVPADMLKALESPYEPSSLEHKVFTLCKESHASVEELAIVLSLDRQYLEQELKDVIEKGYTACKILLRRTQLRSAQDGDSKILTWMGKQILGQQEKMQIDIPMKIIVDTGIRRSLEGYIEENKDESTGKE